MMNPRDFADVLAATIAAVPPEQTELRRRLTKVLEDTAFQAPEARWAFSGEKVKEILAAAFDHVPIDEFAEGWRGIVLTAWMGTEQRPG